MPDFMSRIKNKIINKPQILSNIVVQLADGQIGPDGTPEEKMFKFSRPLEGGPEGYRVAPDIAVQVHYDLYNPAGCRVETQGFDHFVAGLLGGIPPAAARMIVEKIDGIKSAIMAYLDSERRHVMLGRDAGAVVLEVYEAVEEAPAADADTAAEYVPDDLQFALAHHWRLAEALPGWIEAGMKANPDLRAEISGALEQAQASPAAQE